MLVPPGDAEAFTNAILDLGQSAVKRVAIGQAAAKEVRQRFSIKQAIGRYTQLYHQLLGKKYGG